MNSGETGKMESNVEKDVKSIKNEKFENRCELVRKTSGRRSYYVAIASR